MLAALTRGDCQLFIALYCLMACRLEGFDTGIHIFLHRTRARCRLTTQEQEQGEAWHRSFQSFLGFQHSNRYWLIEASNTYGGIIHFLGSPKLYLFLTFCLHGRQDVFSSLYLWASIDNWKFPLISADARLSSAKLQCRTAPAATPATIRMLIVSRNLSGT